MAVHIYTTNVVRLPTARRRRVINPTGPELVELAKGLARFPNRNGMFDMIEFRSIGARLGL